MKQTRLPLCSILLLLTSMAAIFMLQEYGSFQLYNDNPVAKTRNNPVSNSTLLKYYASIDIGEPKLKQEIGSLLDNGNRSRQRSLSSGKDPKLRVARFHIRSKPELNRILSRFRRLLTDWWRNRRFYPDVMSGLVNQISNGKYYKTCAIVGNSGILLRNEYGQLIDSHEFVIRLNNAGINGYEKNVGSKTSVSFVNSNILHSCARKEGCFCHPYGEHVPMIMYICQPAHLLDYLVCNSSYKSPVMITDPQFDVLCSRIVKYYSLKRFVEFEGKEVSEWGVAHDGEAFHYSSGMQAVTLALGICEKVSLFGFGKSDMAKHHYHTNQKAELSLHDYEAEYDFYHDLMGQPETIPFIPDGFKIPLVVIHR